jgi:tRNA(Ile)-lysidine synthase
VIALSGMLSRHEGRPVLVGFSGGLDSSVLLHACAASPSLRDAGLRAIHVHHGLHRDADAWAAHCRHSCDALGIPLAVVRVSVDGDAGDGPEAAARKARHAAFNDALRDGEVLALAHHRDDQAETFLLRALRASGPDGLAAMRPWRRFGRGWLWRPLLDLPRAQLLAYARENDLRWIEDPGNADSGFDRNFLRHHVMPLLRERWSHVDAAFARSAALSDEAVDLLDAGDSLALADAREDDPHVLVVATLLQLPAARRARVFRRWIAELGLPPLPAEGIARIEHELLPAAADRVAGFAWHGALIRRWRGVLHADWQRAPLPTGWTLPWDGREPVRLPDGSLLALEGARHFDAQLVLGARVGGERITLPGRGHSHALKHVLQDLGVAPWMRERLPLLSTPQGELLAAGDVAYSARFDAWLRAGDARLRWSFAQD